MGECNINAVFAQRLKYQQARSSNFVVIPPKRSYGNIENEGENTLVFQKEPFPIVNNLVDNDENYLDSPKSPPPYETGLYNTLKSSGCERFEVSTHLACNIHHHDMYKLEIFWPGLGIRTKVYVSCLLE